MLKLLSACNMPQRCRGLEDPAGGTPRPCIFAADGKGGPAAVKHQRDGKSCAFCCSDAYARACSTRVGKSNITKHLKQWRASGSPCYEAAFIFGIPGLTLPNTKQRDLRRRAGELPAFNTSTSWLHKKTARLKAFLYGKSIPSAPELNQNSIHFLWQCRSGQSRRKMKGWAKTLQAKVQKYGQLRALEPQASRRARQQWWSLRRQLKKRVLPIAALGHPFPPVVGWAIDEKIIPDQHNGAEH